MTSAADAQGKATPTSKVKSAALTPAQPRDSYWELSRRPLTSLLFVAPILLAYELGVLTLGPGALRNAADVWIRQLLGALGFGQYFLLPLLVCGVLLGWHHVRHDPWRMHGRVIGIMWLESLVLGLALLALAQFMGRVFSPAEIVAASQIELRLDAGTIPRSTWSKFIGYLGAGLYEEVLFRLLLLSTLLWLARQAGLNLRGSVIVGLLLTSLAFAAVHYRFELSLFGWSIGPQYGDSFSWFSFLFRVAAGVIFGWLFVLRGFGIVVGAHALYDILVLVTE
ncbi:CAAX amino terminal protease self- immunity [Anatilimnocola aggregata]|uniref:CAAX amino terminal protease self-immunity n=1 Tax=Anatilimnocola aggregata TaxID=2528021 RepID=A0A517YI40_9BACT|nr:CPBP family intramembrane glutamic endopeptidase [Anatilimnocola aggregata]QDU29886.1 CAAX amino terminal protease self- immunity [Anatilimnocola aggregata]